MAPSNRAAQAGFALWNLWRRDIGVRFMFRLGDRLRCGLRHGSWSLSLLPIVQEVRKHRIGYVAYAPKVKANVGLKGLIMILRDRMYHYSITL
ncbi:MAG: hypothetical protein WCI03_10855 [bacterium]